MFCHKCGDKSLEGSAFCQKCGVQLIVNTTAPQGSDAPVSAVAPDFATPASQQKTNEPKKKKSKKLYFGIAGIAVVAIIAIAIAALGGNGGGGESAVEPVGTPLIPVETPSLPAEAPSQAIDTEVVMYNFPTHPFASDVPDFLAFVTNGAEVTTEATLDWDFAVILAYDFDWSEDDLQGYYDLLESLGFTMFDANSARDSDWIWFWSNWVTDDLTIDLNFELGQVGQVWIDISLRNL